MSLKFAVAALAVVVVGLVVGLVVTSSDDHKQARLITTLQREINASELAAKKPSGELAQIAKLQKRVKQLEDCLPEVTTLITSLNLDRQDLLVSPSSQVSRVCSPTVYGPPGE